MAQPSIKTSFASGEWAPKLQSRVDIAKYHSGAALMRNFYVDYSGGGASTRQGTKFIAQVGANGARLIPFQPSTTVSYALEFGAGYIRFYSNGGQIISGGNPYQISSPYAAADLFPNPITGNPGLKWVQNVTSLILDHPNYVPMILTIISPTNWTLNAINFGPTTATPTNLAVVTTLTSTPNSWHYAYLVTAVDVNGQESATPTPVALDNFAELQTTNGTNTLTWTAVTGALSYNVYKASPTFDTGIAAGAQYGFVGNVTATTFTDATPGITPDFSQTPPISQNPFQGAGVAFYTVTAHGSYAGATVPTVAVGAAPAGGVTATAYASVGAISVSGFNTFNGGFAVGQILTNGPSGASIKVTGLDGFGHPNAASIANPGSITSGTVPATSQQFAQTANPANNLICNVVWGVVSVQDVNNGAGYASAPTVTFSSGAATATSTLQASTAGNPGVPGFLQERLWLANQPQAIQTVNMSQPASFFNFNISDPAQDDDAISASLISEELNDIRNMVPVPTGMICFTGKGAWLVNGGGGISTMNPITPANITAQPQAFNGANDLRPLKIGMDVLYGTNKGNYIRDLSYNLYAQIFTGADITTLSNHLFFGFYIPDWCSAEEPFKTVWVIRSDGQLLSLGYVKDQELIGWAHHDTNGQFLSCCSVIETVNGNVVDAVYFIVQRLINGNLVQYVERMADRYFAYGYEDAWSVDCALQTAPSSSPSGPLTITGDASTVGNVVTLTDTADALFTAPMAAGNWVVRAGGGIYEITAFTSSSIVTASVVQVPSLINPYTNTAYTVTLGYTIWEPVTSVSGLTQLEGQSVVGVADGVAVGPYVVSGGGGVNLGLTATKVTLGLQFIPQLKTLPLDLGEPTIQGKRKKIVALTLRVAETLGLSAGTTFNTLVPMKDFQLGAIPTTSSGVAKVTGLISGDGRTIIDQDWQEAGSYCIQQNLPYPATVLGAMPETVVGDSK